MHYLVVEPGDSPAESDWKLLHRALNWRLSLVNLPLWLDFWSAFSI